MQHANSKNSKIIFEILAQVIKQEREKQNKTNHSDFLLMSLISKNLCSVELKMV